MIGKAFAWGLGAMGEAGVTRALEIIRKELDVTMALCGLRDVKDASPARSCAPPSGAQRESPRIHRGGKFSFHRQRLAFEQAGEQFAAEARPEQSARAVGEGAVESAAARIRQRADHRQPVRRHGAEGDAPVQLRCIESARSARQHLLQPREIAGVAVGAQLRVLVVDVVARADQRQAVDPGQRHAPAQEDVVQALDCRHQRQLAAHALKAHPGLRREAQCVRRIGKHDDRGGSDGVSICASCVPVSILRIRERKLHD